MEDSNSLGFSSNAASPGTGIMPQSPGWVHPSDVMRNRKLKAKHRALQARMNMSLPLHLQVNEGPMQLYNESARLSGSAKRRNPFRSIQKKVQKVEEQDTDSSENSVDGTLFKLLRETSSNTVQNEAYNLSELFRRNTTTDTCTNNDDSRDGWSSSLLADWSLKSKIRFLSSKPLPWKHTFKTSEEASGTTGFVRCLKSELPARDGRCLDTSTNAQFYECCLFWQHPSLPTISLFPRDKQSVKAHSGSGLGLGLYGSDPKIVCELQSEWSESLRSLYQLLRVRQCPYFYVCGHFFTSLFRAAGVGGIPHAHAFITPTTKGFRDAMKREGVEFSMPLLNKKLNNSSEEITLESTISENGNCSSSDDDEDGVNREPSAFLEDLGLEASRFPTLIHNRVKENKKYKGVDGSPQSFVYVQDMELHGLINFLLNCGSCVLLTGHMAGVPPTLLSPVAFHGGTLKSLKISGGQVRNAVGELQHSIEIRGPVLPTAVLHLTSLLTSVTDAFSLTLAPVISTLPFSSVVSSAAEQAVPVAFASEGLVDCGLGKDIRAIICSSLPSNKDEKHQQPRTYIEIIYSNGKYKWVDK